MTALMESTDSLWNTGENAYCSVLCHTIYDIETKQVIIWFCPFRMSRGQVDRLMEDLGVEGAFPEDDHGGPGPVSPEASTLILL